MAGYRVGNSPVEPLAHKSPRAENRSVMVEAYGRQRERRPGNLNGIHVPGEGVEPSRGCPRRFLRAPSERFRVPVRANLGRRVFGGPVDSDAGCCPRAWADAAVGVRVGVLITAVPIRRRDARSDALCRSLVIRGLGDRPPCIQAVHWRGRVKTYPASLHQTHSDSGRRLLGR
jgi:hypothetical protein